MTAWLRATALALACSGCAIATPAFTPPGPGSVADLETRWDSDRTDVPAALSLIAAHVRAGELTQARAVAEATQERVPSHPTLLLVLGMLAHEQGEPSVADGWYEAYFAQRPRGSGVDDVVWRLEAVRPRVLLDKAAARLDEFSGTGDWPAAADGSMAFLPFSAATEQDEWLAAAVAEFAARDFSVLSQDVVDAAHVRALVRVEDAGPDELSTMAGAARLGGILGAGAVVFGAVDRPSPGRLRLTGAVLTALDGMLAVTSFEFEAPADEARTLATRVAVRARRLSSGPVAADEVAELAVGPAVSQAALLAFGRGLGLASEGDHRGSADAYREALEIAPGFTAAADAAERAQRAADADAEPLLDATVEAVRAGERRDAVATLQEHLRAPARSALDRSGGRRGSLAAEIFGRDRLMAGTLLDLLFTFPVGGP